MRKKIGVFMGELGAEYQHQILDELQKKARSLGYDVLIFANYGGFWDDVLYAEGEKNILYLPKLSEFDGIVVGMDTFGIEGMREKAREHLLKATCPVVCVKSYEEGFYNVLVADREPMKDMVEHFIRVHGFGRICFMQGNMTYQDAKDRYQGYLDAMSEAGIPVTPHMVFEGDYWREKGKAAVEWFYDTPEENAPQVIVCANDYMAISVCKELKARGIRIPEDVCVSGYDDMLEARRHQPSITSIRVEFSELADKALEMIANVLEGKPQEMTEWIQPGLALHKSCGCAEQGLIEDVSWMLYNLYVQDSDLRKSVFMATECQDAYTEEEISHVIQKYFATTRGDVGYLCLQREEDIKEDTIFANELELSRIFHADGSVEVIHRTFERTGILPEEYMDTKEPICLVIHGIHYKNTHFGYWVTQFGEGEWVDCFMQPFLANLANALDGLRVRKKMDSLEEFRSLYMQDALTGIPNRRGFDKQLRTLYDQRGNDNRYLSIVSIDMDGLKYINDNFGHAEGDKAICILADILSDMMGEDELCARMGGDEFAALLLSADPQRHLRFGAELKDRLLRQAKQSEHKYPIHASVGICCITEETNLSLLGCIQKADQNMYEEKSHSHFSRRANQLKKEKNR